VLVSPRGRGCVVTPAVCRSRCGRCRTSPVERCQGLQRLRR
jgi:hypothetical protein